MSLSKAELARRKEARRIARSTDHDKRALEVRLVREGKIYPRAHYRPRGTFRAIVAIALAFCLGLFGGLGGFLGAGLIVASTVKIGDIPGLSGYITEDYKSDTLLKLISDLASDISKGDLKTLGDIAKYTTAIDDPLLSTLKTNLEAFGIDFGEEMQGKFKATTFDKLGDFFMDDVIKSAELGKLADVDANSDAMLLALCYGEEGEDYDIINGRIVLKEGATPTKVGDLMENPTETLNDIRLGTLMGLNKDVTEQKLSDNAMMYALSYGKRGVDYEVEEGRIKILTDKGKKPETENQTLAKEDGTGTKDGSNGEGHVFPTTLKDLMEDSSLVINALELGTVLGIDQDVKEEDVEKNGVMYALSYGARGEDWELDVEAKQIVMLDGHDEKYPTKMEEFTSNSDALIQGMEVETLMSIKPGSDKLMHYLAYGAELSKGEAFANKDTPWAPDAESGFYKDAKGELVDENGYLIDADGNYRTETVPVKDANGKETVDENGDPVTKVQYLGDGRYVYVYAKTEDGSFILDENNKRQVIGIRMLPDPNETGTPTVYFQKKQVKDLTDEDAKVLDGVKMGAVMEIDSGSSALMKAIKEWTIEDLKDPDKIDSLKVSEVIGEDAGSNIMQAFAKRGTTLGDLKNQDTIDNLKLSEVLNIDETSSGIMKAMKNWKISDLSDQKRIDRLKLSQVIGIDEGSSNIMKAMKDWRISDLSDQEKIDSLTLGDVLTIDDESPLLLKNLASSQLGELSTRVNNLRLSELLEEKDIEDNKILKNLRGSTLETLSDDIQKISVSQVFGDQMYSYMVIEKNKQVNLLQANGEFEKKTVTVDYNWLYTTYFGKAASNSDGHHEFNYNYPQYNGLKADGSKDSAAFSFRPTAVTPTNLIVQRVLGKDEATKVTEGYFVKTMSGSEDVYTAVPADKEIYYDLIEKVSEGDTKETEKKYYYENDVQLTAVYEYGVYDYEKGAVEAWQELTDGKFLYNDTPLEVKQDEDSGDYYIEVYATPAEGETATDEPERVDLDRRVKHYTVNGEKVEFVTKEGTEDRTKIVYNGQELLVRHAKPQEGDPYDYVTEKIFVERKFAAGNKDVYNADEVYDEGDTKELYFDGDQQLDRYISGVWYLLLGEKDETSGTIHFNTDKEILKMDESISDVSNGMQNTLLAELWFHGLIDENPYTDLTTIPTFSDGLTFQPDGQEKPHKVYNLIEVTLNETLGLVKALVSELTKTP